MSAEFMNDFLMSIESECLTSVQSATEPPEVVLQRGLEIMSSLAPSLPGFGGFFNPYGRVYIDCNWHLEFAACECASPYDLPGVVERQQTLAAEATRQLKTAGHHLLLANNNHSGLLTASADTWGTHENYLVEQSPATFGKLILPFLVTRVFGGAGGIEYPSGRFLFGVRSLRMELAAGGATTESRAIHSLARDENHMGSDSCRFRYHLLLGDGHASHWNLALQVGCTLLAIKAIFYDRKLQDDLGKLGEFSDDSWVPMLRRLNVMAAVGQPPRVDPFVILVQRMYHAAAERFARRLAGRPAWVERMLQDWAQTLDALEHMNLDWLAARLDAFAKYQLYSAVLAEQGQRWADLPRSEALFHELALLDHSYHSFCDPKSAFRRLESAGLLRHRVSERIEPGREPRPYVTNLGTRADARARFLVEHAHRKEHIMDWSFVATNRDRALLLCDPFAQAYENEDSSGEESLSHIRAWRMLHRRVLGVV